MTVHVSNYIMEPYKYMQNGKADCYQFSSVGSMLAYHAWAQGWAEQLRPVLSVAQRYRQEDQIFFGYIMSLKLACDR